MNSILDYFPFVISRMVGDLMIRWESFTKFILLSEHGFCNPLNHVHLGKYFGSLISTPLLAYEMCTDFKAG